MGWDADYTARGVRWGGAAAELPTLPAGSTVLECGCGNGKTLAAMRSQQWQAVGIDISRAAVSLASGRGSAAVAGDITSLPFADACFDAVFCWHVLGHLPCAVWVQASSEMRRVLKPDGTLFFKGFSRNDLRYGSGREVAPHSYLRGDGITTHYFTGSELHEVFGEGELTTVSWNMRVRGIDHRREELCGVFGGMVLTDPIVGDWTKTVMFAGTMYCRFHVDNTGIAKGKVFGHTVNEPFTWHPTVPGIYRIRAYGEEHNIRLRGDKLETEFRGFSLEMDRVR